MRGEVSNVKTYKIAVIAGDGIGPEALAEGIRSLTRFLNLMEDFLLRLHIFLGVVNIILKMVK